MTFAKRSAGKTVTGSNPVLSAINWHRVIWIAVFAAVIFNAGACERLYPQACNPLHPVTCEP